MILLIILYSLLFVFLAIRRLDLAVMLLIIALPSYLIRFKIFGIPSTLLEIMILIVFAVWLVKNYKTIFLNLKSKILNLKSEIIYDYPFKWEMIFFIIISFAAAGISGFSNNAMGIWKAYFFEPLLLYLVIINVFIKNNQLEKLLWAFLVSALGVSLLAVYQKITGDLITNPIWANEATRRTVSFFGYPNAVGLYLGPLVLIFTGWLSLFVVSVKAGIQKEKRWKILIIIFTVILSLLAIYFARSEGALIGISIALIIFGLMAGKTLKWTTLILTAILGVTILSCPPIRIYTYKIITLKDFSGQVRKAQWSETWRMLKDGRLITGAGLDNYQNSLSPYHVNGFFYDDGSDPEFHKKTVFNAEYRKAHWQPLEIYKYPHNIFLNFWSEISLAGMLLFIWIVLKFYYLGFKNLFRICPALAGLEFGILDNKKNRFVLLGLLGAMAVIIIHGLVDVPYFKNDLAVTFWILIAMIGIIDIKRKSGRAVEGAALEKPYPA